MINRFFRLQNITAQALFLEYSLVRHMVDIVVGSFFIIFVYRTTNSFSMVILSMMTYYIGIAAGYPVAILALNNYTYQFSYKLAFLLGAIFFGYSSYNYDKLPEFILLFTFVYGFIGGSYYVTNNLFALTELQSRSRQSLLIARDGIKNIVGAILPAVTGLIIVENGYRETFAMAAVIFVSALLLPSQGKINKPDSFSFAAFRQMVRLKGMKQYTATMLIMESVNTIREISFILAAFLILSRNEFSVGLLTSGVVLVSGIYGLFLKRTKSTELGSYLGAFLFIPLNLLLGLMWDPISVTIRALLMPIGSIIYNPRMDNLHLDIMQNILGKYNRPDGLEMQTYRETMLLISRVTACLLYVFLLQYFDYVLISQLLIVVFAPWGLVLLVSYKKLNRYILNFKKATKK